MSVVITQGLGSTLLVTQGYGFNIAIRRGCVHVTDYVLDSVSGADETLVSVLDYVLAEVKATDEPC